MFEYPFKVSYKALPNYSIDSYTQMAKWCVKNLGRDDWLHDPWEFEFRKEEDYLQFLLTWS
jgi:hypothetical protein